MGWMYQQQLLLRGCHYVQVLASIEHPLCLMMKHRYCHTFSGAQKVLRRHCWHHSGREGYLLDWISGKSCAGVWDESCHFLRVMGSVPAASELSHRDVNLESFLEHHLGHPGLCAAYCLPKPGQIVPA